MICGLRKCCCVISLRVGCMISALLLIFFELIAVPLRNAKPCCDSFEGVIAVVYRVLEIVNFVGCLMLFVASFVKTSVLVSLFLATSSLHTLLYPAFLVAEVVIWNADIVDISLSILGIVLGIYIWIVALAFYFECKEDVFKDDGTSPDLRKKGSIIINSLDF
ncbi:uncharacterized protein LOC128260777 [Drosophila gunungcola]|uniref:Uncharacterized protein n=1 Tax=Drosophila gunungcola TaxID=103775 RepID=A0A9P9YE53_9MUSC|nr:uncharacterized protein LOC128260777 [Drosophila gunungcola]KAI8035291.1 hypothetical protein M5D96_011949 [Drosophila gunungcola]